MSDLPELPHVQLAALVEAQGVQIAQLTAVNAAQGMQIGGLAAVNAGLVTDNQVLLGLNQVLTGKLAVTEAKLVEVEKGVGEGAASAVAQLEELLDAAVEG